MIVLFLELHSYTESDISQAGLHKVIQSLEVGTCKCDTFRIERGFVVNHPKIASYEGNCHIQFVIKPFLR